MSELPEYRLDRVFDAPRELVWRAWTDPEILHRWYGPGAETIIHTFDLQPEERPGGGRGKLLRLELQYRKISHRIPLISTTGDQQIGDQTIVSQIPGELSGQPFLHTGGALELLQIEIVGQHHSPPRVG